MMKIKATTPCYKFINATPDEQQDKLMEKVLKVSDAWKELQRDYNYENLKALLMELIDVKACVNTAIVQLDRYVMKENLKISEKIRQLPASNDMFSDALKMRALNESQIIFNSCLRDAKDAVVDKNLRRGYYLEDKE